MHAKRLSQMQWLQSDGTATTHFLRRPDYKLVHLNRAERTSRELEEWDKVQENAAKDARIRAVQLHFQLIARLSHALPSFDSHASGHQARRVNTSVTLPRDLDEHELGRTWIYDTGCSASAVGIKHLTPAERKRIYQVDGKKFFTAAGFTSTCSAVNCYVPYLGKRRCYVLVDCPPALSVNEDIEVHGSIFTYGREI